MIDQETHRYVQLGETLKETDRHAPTNCSLREYLKSGPEVCMHEKTWVRSREITPVDVEMKVFVAYVESTGVTVDPKIKELALAYDARDLPRLLNGVINLTHSDPMAAWDEIIEILVHGEIKYGSFNWKSVRPFEGRYWPAAGRHFRDMIRFGINAIDDGVGGTGKFHRSHFGANIVFLSAGPE
jgi:hypothetical protein